MEISYQQAVNFLNKQNKISIIACIKPEYLIIDAKRDSSLNPTFFLYEYESDFFYHAFHKSQIPNSHYYDIQSPYGYGGPIATTENKTFLKKAWDAYLDFCRENNVIIEFIRFHPMLENWKYYSGEVFFNRETVWVDIQLDDLLSSYQETRVRTAIRKAIKSNVTIKFLNSSEFQNHFKLIYLERMRQLKTSEFYFFNDEYINSLCSWKKTCLAAAIHNNKICAVLISLICGDLLEIHLCASTPESKNVCATNLIYHETFELARKNGCKKVHFGGGTTNQTNDPLLFFKEGFSKNKAQYNIGRYIHNEYHYKNLKSIWEKQHGTTTKNILFYQKS